MENNTKLIKGYFPKEFIELRKFGKETRKVLKVAKAAYKQRKKDPLSFATGTMHLMTYIALKQLTHPDPYKLSYIGVVHLRTLYKEFYDGLNKYSKGIDLDIAKVNAEIEKQFPKKQDINNN